MSDSQSLAIVGLLVIAVFLIIRRLEHRAKTDGALFTKPPTVITRIFAGLLGLVLVAFVFVDPISILYEWILPLAALTLLAYSAGVGDLLVAPKRPDQASAADNEWQDASFRRLSNVLAIGLLGVGTILALLYGGAWILATPALLGPVSILLAIGCVAFIPLVYIFHALHIWSAVRKRGQRPEK